MKELASTFVRASQQLADAMLKQLQNDDPVMAAQVVDAVQRGETLVVACSFSDSARVELTCVSDYGTSRRVCEIPMGLPPVH